MKKYLRELFAIGLIYFAAMGTALGQKTPQGVTYDATIVRINDGDTVVIAAPFLPAPLRPELAVRVFGVDTPEKNHLAKCESEKQRGLAATEFTKKMVNQSQQRQVVLYGWDKFGGRVLGDILLNGQSLRMLLIQNGFAREYFGEAKTSWC
jgi:endonuclease YncB( thermonuclease family)